jgi:hypothetical protein
VSGGDGSRGGRMSQTLLQLGSSAVNSRGVLQGGHHHQGQMYRHGKAGGGGGMPGLEAALLQAARHQHGAQGKRGSIRRMDYGMGGAADDFCEKPEQPKFIVAFLLQPCLHIHFHDSLVQTGSI